MDELTFPRKLLSLGDRIGALQELARLIQMNPRNIDAWLLLADAADENLKKADCYRQVLRLDPENKQAQEGLKNIIQVGADKNAKTKPGGDGKFHPYIITGEQTHNHSPEGSIDGSNIKSYRDYDSTVAWHEAVHVAQAQGIDFSKYGDNTSEGIADLKKSGVYDESRRAELRGLRESIRRNIDGEGDAGRAGEKPVEQGTIECSEKCWRHWTARD